MSQSANNTLAGRMSIKKKLMLIAFIILSFWKSYSQEALITLKDSLKIRTELVAIKGIYLITKSGTLGINEIYSFRFANEGELERNPELSKDLLNTGIIIYIGNEKLKSIQSDEWAKKLQVHEPVAPTPETPKEDVEVASFGVGVGLDYGGLGGRFSYQVNPQLGAFISGGYAIAGVGFNIGMRGRLNPEKNFIPTLSVMYGYNGAIQITGGGPSGGNFNKVYYGPSIGVGFERRLRNLNRDYWQLELLVPFRSAEYDRDIAYFKSIISSTPLPIAISVGYHWVIHNRQ
ncbi:hypothetical protein BH09BAC3_BH09BAC3_07640 [soil metagenome]